MAQRVPQVVVLGGGFGGLSAVRRLRRGPVVVTLIDRCNYHLFQPLLYQVATAALSPADIAYPLRTIVRDAPRVRVLMAEVRDLDLTRRVVVLDGGEEEPYDYLIVALGATHAYFGHDDWAAVAPGLKTIQDAIEIRGRFLKAFELAEREDDRVKRRALLTFAIIGAGATGVELAGAMAEVAQSVLKREFRHIHPETARILLIEGAERVLGVYPPELSERARRQLERLGVEVLTNAPVTSIAPGRLTVGGEELEVENVFWAAGVAASPIGACLGVPTDRAGRVLVEPDLTVPGHPEVYVAGDLAALTDARGQRVPGVAPAANQMGAYAADSIVRRLRGRPGKPFVYRDKGSLAVIGRGAGVAWFRRLRLGGLVAWAAWLAVHIYFLIGFRNRLLVMLKWAWAYFSVYRGARLITIGEPRGPAQPDVMQADSHASTTTAAPPGE